MDYPWKEHLNSIIYRGFTANKKTSIGGKA